MGIVLQISIAFFVWWIISIFYLPALFKIHTLRRMRARKKYGKLIVKIAFAIYAGGGMANASVVAANDWKMPVREYGPNGEILVPENGSECARPHDSRHTCIHKKTRLAFFADIFYFRSIGYMLSIGDLLLVAGTVLMTLQRIWIFLPACKTQNFH